LKDKAAAFKKLFVDNGALNQFENGQFTVSSAMQEKAYSRAYTLQRATLATALSSLIKGSGRPGDPDRSRAGQLLAALSKSGMLISGRERRSLPEGHADKAKPIGCVRGNVVVAKQPIYGKETKDAHDAMNDPAVTPEDKAEAKAILDDTSATGDWAASTTYAWLGKSKLEPIDFDSVSLPRYIALHFFAKVGCGSTAGATGLQLLGSRGISAASVPKISETLIDTSKRDPEGKLLVIKYSESKLANAINKTKAVLTAGGYVLAGCVSGLIQDPDHPPVEHYILIFGFEGDRFLFWDPDVSVTDIAIYADSLPSPIGLLYYKSGPGSRFSTAEDDADLTDLDGDGMHNRHPKRKRYQVVLLTNPTR
jgi:hypothetical protein